MKLLQVDLFYPQIAKALLGAFDDVAIRENIFDLHLRRGRPNPILRRNLGGDEDSPKAFAYRLAHQLFTVPIAVGERRVDEIDAQLESFSQSLNRFVVFAALPLLTADTPGAKPDFADFRFCRS